MKNNNEKSLNSVPINWVRLANRNFFESAEK